MEVLQRTANRGSISTGPYQIDNSCKFEEDNSEFLWKTFSGEGTGTGKTFTVSAWVKRTELSGIDIVMGVGRAIGSDANDGAIRFNSDQFQFVNFASNAYNVRTNAVFRDTSAWYHIMVAVDTTQGTDSNRVKLYVNGEQQTSLTGTAYPTQNYQFKWGRAEEHMVGARPDSDATAGEPQASQFWSGYMADVYFVDGQQLAPTDFGEYDSDSGIWKPINASPTFGNNGFYLDFADASDLGDDESGNGNDFAEVNLAAADQATDTPTNSFAINNIIDGGVNTSNSVSYKEGGTVQIRNQNTNYNYNFSTLGMTKGKWYAEFQRGSATNIMIGVQLQNFDSTLSSRVNTYIGMGADNHGGAFSAGGAYFYNNTASTGHTAYGTSDILGVAVDCDNNKIYFSVNGTYVNSGNPASGSNGFDFGPLETNEPCFFVMNSRDPNKEHKANFGGYTTISISSAASDENGYGNFEYAPPTGYYALCTKNLAEYG